MVTINLTTKIKAPLGILGTIVEKLVLKKYIRDFLLERNKVLKEYAENKIF
ncbi:MAG: Unknown protein [uncultured Sulfurovum sp.]|uniref:Uncharacterized protein n=1 Tax=uncultured Sulfurovum sp. TaxID=269237 RepID=A0A6S6TDN7_9BACT|nr:MAG: Unknown protein [uncultured Sulfurovum sp.]